jgi:TatA/E family protein of Tat protein translocase
MHCLLIFQEVRTISKTRNQLFGSEKIPDIAKGLGQGLREFKRAMDQPAEEEQEHPRPMQVISKSDTNSQEQA